MTQKILTDSPDGQSAWLITAPDEVEPLICRLATGTTTLAFVPFGPKQTIHISSLVVYWTSYDE